MRAGQRPVLAWNDPLNIFGRQRQQTLLIATAECCKEILHNLDILSISVSSDSWSDPLPILQRAVIPPSTWMFPPVIHFPRSDKSNATTSARSSGDP